MLALLLGRNYASFLKLCQKLWVYLGVRTCELFFVLSLLLGLGSIMLTSLFSLFHVTGEFHRFLHRGRAKIMLA